MRRTTAILMPVAVALVCLPLALSCRPRPRVPGWVKTAPGDSFAAVSAQAGWVLTHKDLQSFLSKDPLVERALDLFLQKARINPRTETGRVTFHLLGVPKKGETSLQNGLEHALVQLNQFKDPGALVTALAESFPQEGSLQIQGRDWPLFVILDVEAKGTKAHIRAASDEKGQIWIGSLEALGRMANKAGLASQPDVALAADWINPHAPFQGYAQLDVLMAGLRQNLDGSLIKDLPQGVHAMFWSITPPTDKDQAIRFELALAGTPEGINQVTPWIQRLVAAANAVRSAPGAAPELMQERQRVGLRATLTPEQLKLVMDKLGLPGISIGPGGKGPVA
jgi:hypothetical protein